MTIPICPTMGLKDEPLANSDEDRLSLGEHADILSEFICKCDTPLTIGIQGDWGTGKTSMINIIQHKLNEDPQHRYKTVLFNTWQYSQFNLADDLVISLISDLIEKVSENISADEAEKQATLLSALNDLGKAGERALLFTASLAASRIAGTDINVQDHLSQNERKALRPAQVLAKLKEDVQTLVNNARKHSRLDRFVIFIDDLDRLVPSRAVELLEALKLFLDVKGCVFVLACDYNVISRGVAMKFGLEESYTEGRSFFDKIIQVPYNMPVHKYKSLEYIKDLITQITGDTLPSDRVANLYKDLLESSVSLNPRSCKRVFNSFLLLRLVSNKENLFEDETSHSLISEDEKGLLLFAAICLQMGFEKAFKEMTKGEITQKWFDNVFDDEYWMNEVNLKKLASDNRESNQFRLFIRHFYKAVQLDSDGDDDNFSDEEAATLARVLSSSTITAVADNDEEDYDDDPDVPQYIQRFFSLLEKSDVVDADARSGVWDLSEGRTSTFQGGYSFDDDNQIVIQIDIGVKKANIKLFGEGETAEFRYVRDAVVSQFAERWSEARGNTGRLLQKRIDYVEEVKCEKQVVLEAPKDLAELVLPHLKQAVQDLQEAIDSV